MINLQKNLKNSMSGFNVALSDSSFRAELILGAIVLPIVLMISESVWWSIAATFAYMLLLSVELINTAIEVLCDRITKEHDEAIKAVKDMASAAVFLILVIFLVLCCIALFGIPKP